MPGSDSPLDLSRPYPKAIIETLRQSLVAQIDGLRQAVEDLGYTADDAVLGLDMADTLFALLDSAMAANDSLAARVDALEAAAIPPIAPTPEVAP